MTEILPANRTYNQLSAEYYNFVKPAAFPEEIAFYQGILEKTSGPSLYAMCGSGRLFLPLLENGYDIEGLDYSLSMLENCREKAHLRGLKPILYQQSIAEMSLETKYDNIFIIGGSFQLIYPRELAIKALHAAKNHLNARGRLFIDTFIPWEFLYENGQEENFANEIQRKDGTSIRIETYSLANKNEQYFRSHNKYTRLKEGKVVQTEEEDMPVLWYYHYETILLLQSVGFESIKTDGTKIGEYPELTVYEAIR